jgi:hypothetical protein
MRKAKKLIERFSLKPNDFTYDELKILLKSFGYEEAKTGKTAGARAAFINRANRHIIRLHKPHPGNILKHYQLNSIEEELKRKGVIQ